jgi:hypothetical protein
MLRLQNSLRFPVKFLPASLPCDSVGICETALIDELRMIRTQIETRNRPEKLCQYAGRFLGYHSVTIQKPVTSVS